MPNDAMGIDVGNILSNVEQIKSARIQNIINERSLTDEEKLRDLRGKALDGRIDAMNQMAVIDPKQAEEVRRYYAGLKDDEKKQFDENVTKAGQMGAWVLNQPNREQAYADAREMLMETNPKLAAQMPEKFNESWVELQVAQASTMKDIIDQGDGGKPNTTGAPKDMMWTKDGTGVVPIPGGPLDPKNKATAPNSLDNAVSSNIRLAVQQAFGGMYDPVTGEMGFNDPTTAQRAMGVMAQAEKLAQGGMAPLQAVQQAMQQAGGNVLTPGAAPATPGAPLASPAAPAPGGVIRFDQL